MKTNVDSTVDAIKELVALFKTERVVYMIITAISALVLISTAIVMIVKDNGGTAYVQVTGLFGSTGGILYATGRLLKMFNEALSLVREVITGNNNGQNDG